ncbi:MAG: hypothetical protein ABSG41_03555 [Bryobacteraceae bacterium]|jgi:hypothetical protein
MKPYDRVLAIAKVYMGPAAESFLARQCTVGLKIEAANIAIPDFKYLAIWVEVAACRFIETAKAAEMAKRIAGLC